MTEVPPVTGGCMCGAIRYEAKGPPRDVAFCHCNSCRKHTGAPVTAYVAFDREWVEFTRGDRKLYESSPGVYRAFCGECGTSLTWEAPSSSIPGRYTLELHICTLDDPDALVPESHVFHGERISWFDVHDTLPRYKTEEEEPYIHGPVV